MPVPYFIHPQLRNLDFNVVDLYDFARYIYDNFNKQSVFQPTPIHILPCHQKDLLQWFPESCHLVEFVTFEFYSFMREKLLKLNGYELNKGFVRADHDISDWF